MDFVTATSPTDLLHISAMLTSSIDVRPPPPPSSSSDSDDAEEAGEDSSRWWLTTSAAAAAEKAPEPDYSGDKGDFLKLVLFDF